MGVVGLYSAPSVRIAGIAEDDGYVCSEKGGGVVRKYQGRGLQGSQLFALDRQQRPPFQCLQAAEGADDVEQGPPPLLAGLPCRNSVSPITPPGSQGN